MNRKFPTELSRKKCRPSGCIRECIVRGGKRPGLICKTEGKKKRVVGSRGGGTRLGRTEKKDGPRKGKAPEAG